MAGTIPQTKSEISPQTCLDYSISYNQVSHIQWILDIGATDHMVYSISLLTSITSKKPNQVHLPSKTYVEVTHICTRKVSDKLILNNVLYVHSFSFNLIFASKLTQESPICLIFLQKFCFIQDLSSWMTIGLAEVSNGLYFLKHQPPSCHAVQSISTN